MDNIDINGTADANLDEVDDKANEEANDDTLNNDCQEAKISRNEAILKMVNKISETYQEDVEEVQKIPVTLVTIQDAVFSIARVEAPTYLNIRFICEMATRVLFKTIHWLKQLPITVSLK